jgi:CheY-like chemotaxis protein
LNILVVEDNEINRLVAREMLTREGHRVTEASDGDEGIRIAASNEFDLILMDISMPGIDGVEATRMIRTGDGASRNVPIIGLTAHALPAEQERFAEVGMQDCLVKPLRLAKLQRFLAGFCVRTDAGPERADHDPGREHRSAARPGLIDEETLSDLSSALSEEVFARTLRRFVDEVGTVVPELSEMIGDSELKAVGAKAHKLAGSAAIVGAERMHAILRNVEDSCRAGDIGTARSLILVELAEAALETSEVLANIGGHLRP